MAGVSRYVTDPEWGNGWVCDGCERTWFRFRVGDCPICGIVKTMNPKTAEELLKSIREEHVS